MLEARHISVHRGGRRVLGPLSVTLRGGQLTAVCGPNGAGKTTLLKVLSGEIVARDGIVTLDGHSLKTMSAPELARRRAVVPQATSLNFPFTVIEVVQLGASVPGFAAEANHWATQAINRVGLTGMEDRFYLELSAGEKQRVHFARAICQLLAAGVQTRASTILLLDEPTSNLDLPHQGALLARSKEEAAKGRIVVAVLHDLNLAAKWADRLILLTRGMIIGDGPPIQTFSDELLSQAYGCRIRVNQLPERDMPFVLPQTVEL